MKITVWTDHDRTTTTVDTIRRNYSGPTLVQVITTPPGMEYMINECGLVLAHSLVIFCYRDGRVDTREWPAQHTIVDRFVLRILKPGSLLTLEQE